MSSTIIKKYYSRFDWIDSPVYLAPPEMKADEIIWYRNLARDTQGEVMALICPHTEDIFEGLTRFWMTFYDPQLNLCNTSVSHYGYWRSGVGMSMTTPGGNSFIKFAHWVQRDASGPKFTLEVEFDPTKFQVDFPVYVVWLTPAITGAYRVDADFTGSRGPRVQRRTHEITTDYYLLSDEPDDERSRRSPPGNDDERDERAQKRQRLIEQFGSKQAVSSGGGSF